MLDIDTLTGHRQSDRFTEFIKILAEKYNPIYIFCFNKESATTIKEGCFTDSVVQENHHYHLLMVTEGLTRIEHHVQNYANDHFQFGTITMLVQGIEAIAHGIHQNNRFFITVFNGAKLLYRRDQSIASLEVTGFVPTRAAAKASKHHQTHMLLASGFLESARECQENRILPLSIFMLHQVVEQCCICLIRIFLSYRSDIHHLHKLLNLCSSFSAAPANHFQLETDEGRRLFNILVKSYSDARYKDDFCVGQSDAAHLYSCVSSFRALAEQMCLEKINTLALEAEVYKQI